VFFSVSLGLLRYASFNCEPMTKAKTLRPHPEPSGSGARMDIPLEAWRMSPDSHKGQWSPHSDYGRWKPPIGSGRARRRDSIECRDQSTLMPTSAYFSHLVKGPWLSVTSPEVIPFLRFRTMTSCPVPKQRTESVSLLAATHSVEKYYGVTTAANTVRHRSSRDSIVCAHAGVVVVKQREGAVAEAMEIRTPGTNASRSIPRSLHHESEISDRRREFT